jgi:levansucrase
MLPRQYVAGAAFVLHTLTVGSDSFGSNVSEGAPPLPTPHTQAAFALDDDVVAKWTRADAMQIKALSHKNKSYGENTLPLALTMPLIADDLPLTHEALWVWDPWPLTDKHLNQQHVNGWEIIFALTSRRGNAADVDRRHGQARIGFFYRRADVLPIHREPDGGWLYGGQLFPEGASRKQLSPIAMTHHAEWSGSARLLDERRVVVYYTAVAFDRPWDASGGLGPQYQVISMAMGAFNSSETGVTFSAEGDHKTVLMPDGVMYETTKQVEDAEFRDPVTFEDPAHPGKVLMIFSGTTPHGEHPPACTESDLGYQKNDRQKESLRLINASGAGHYVGNIGLAIAQKSDETKWKLLQPILSARCVNREIERPTMYVRNGKYYLFFSTHRRSFAPGLDGPEGLYGFVGTGVRSDFLPMNGGSGLVIGNPVDLNQLYDGEVVPTQHKHWRQSFAHYPTPNGIVYYYARRIGTRFFGTIAPTVKITIDDANSSIDNTHGRGGFSR